MNKDIEKLKILKEIFKDNYDEFINIVSSDQNEINCKSTYPIDNYQNSIIKEKDKELLKYIYKNIRHYFDVNGMYTSKMSEGMAIFVSKAIILKQNNIPDFRHYFTKGNYRHDREIANPFEEMARLLINAIVNDTDLKLGTTSEAVTLQKIQADDRKIFEGLNLAISENSVFDKMTMYDNVDSYIDMCADLEMSDINSEYVNRTTLESNRELLLTQLDRIVDIYNKKIDFEQMLNGYPTQAMSNKMKTQFENKMIYAKRNIGVYEKTKQLVKKSQN